MKVKSRPKVKWPLGLPGSAEMLSGVELKLAELGEYCLPVPLEDTLRLVLKVERNVLDRMV